MPMLRDINGPDAPAIETAEMDGAAVAMGQGQQMMMSAADFRYDQLVSDPEQLKRLGQTVTNHLDEIRRYCKQGRDRRNFDRRLKRNEARAQCKVNIAQNDDGTTNKLVEDAHAKLKINQGWTFQSNRTASKEIFFKLFRSAPRPYVVQGFGNKAENDKLEVVVEGVIERMLRKGRFYTDIAQRLCDMLPIYGSVFLRFDYTFPHEMKREEGGTFREAMEGEQSMPGGGRFALFDRYKALTPEFTLWPVEDVLVTDWDMPHAKDQEGIFFLTPQTTVRRLESQEAVYVWEGTESDVGLEFIRHQYGRFINMRSLREDERKNMGNAIRSNSTKYQETDSRTSSFPPFGLIEYEGALPMSKWVEDGQLTPELAQYYEIDVGYWPEPMVDPATGQMTGYTKESLREWGRRLDSIRYWQVAYTGNYETEGGSLGTENGIGQHLLQFRPCPYRKGRPSLYNFVYFPDRDEFLGMSICDAGWRMENHGDTMLNAIAWRKFYNSDPSGTVNTDGLENPADAERIMNPGFIAPVTRKGLTVGDIVTLNELSNQSDDFAALEHAKFEFENMVGIPPIAKGAVNNTATGTATELQMSAQRSSGQLDFVAYNASTRFADLFRDVVCLAYEILGPEEFQQFAIYCSGRNAADLEHALNEIINEEFDVVSSLANTEDPAVQGQMQQRLYQLTAMSGQWNDREFIKSNARLLRIPDIERCLQFGEAAMTPKSEHFQMAEGTTIRVHPDDDDMVHLKEHSAMAAAVRTGEALQYFTPEQVVEIEKQIEAHMLQHEMQFQQKMAMQSQPMGGGPGAGKGAGQEGKAKPPRQEGQAQLEMDTNAASTSGMRANINERAMA